MTKKTTAEVVKALALTPKALLLTLVYHPELRPSALSQPLSWSHFRHAQWSDIEIERVRAHRINVASPARGAPNLCTG